MILKKKIMKQQQQKSLQEQYKGKVDCHAVLTFPVGMTLINFENQHDLRLTKTFISFFLN